MPKQTVLIIEDEPELQEILTYNLEALGYQVHVYDHGTRGLEAVQKLMPDIILLDVMLPGMDGLEVCRHLRSNNSTKRIPIMMLTAKSEEVDQLVGFQMGADDYVTKPFSVRELILRIKAVLKRGQKDSKEVVEVERQFGDLRIDVESHEVHVDSKPIELTALEFRLLNELVDKRGRVQSRDQLLSEVWGYNAEVTTRTVDTHIKRLREKLGPTGKYVQTIRGVGYKFSRIPD